MRTFFPAITAAALLFAVSAQAETILANVKGMHCVGCAQAIEANLGEDAAVQSVTVDVKAGTATIIEKSGKHIDDARIETLVKEAGYRVTGMVRSAN